MVSLVGYGLILDSSNNINHIFLRYFKYFLEG